MIRRSVVLAFLLVGVCAASSTLAASSLDEGLIGHWPFTEGQGEQSADRGPYRAHAVLNRVGWATGEFGTAVSVGKLNSNLVIPNKRALTPAEVALLAERKGRDSGEIKVVPPVQPRTLASFETRCATLTLNEAGWVTSLQRGGMEVGVRHGLPGDST